METEMKKNRIARFVLRMLAYILLTITLGVFCLGGLGTTYIVQNRMLLEDTNEFILKEDAKLEQRIAQRLLHLYLTEGLDEAMNYCDNTSIYFAIYAMYSGRRVGGNMSSSLESKSSVWYFLKEDVDWGIRVPEVQDYRIKLYIPPEGVGTVQESQLHNLAIFIAKNCYRVLAYTVICFLLSVLLIVGLVSTADKNFDEGILYRIPLELLVVAMVVGTRYLATRYFFGIAPEVHVWYSVLVTGVLATLCAVHLILRFKQKFWYRRTLCYGIWLVIRGIGRFFATLYRNLPLIWKALLMMLVLTAIEAAGMVVFGPSIKSAGTFEPINPNVYSYFRLVGEGTIDTKVLCLWILFVLEKIIVIPGVLYGVMVFKKLHQGTKELASGNLKYQLDVAHMPGMFREFSEDLNEVSESIQIAVEERVKSERLKTELITNVSHDIKTPLTSIINFADLITKEETENTKITEYAEHLYSQSTRLKKLIEDLMEASKASTGNLEVNLERCDVGVLLGQCMGEYEERLNLLDMDLIVKKSEEPMWIMADTKMLCRVFDNLMNNICKYAQSNTRVYLSTERVEDKVFITFKNISKYPLDISAEDLMERFVRGDLSRHTEGNGLGLSIVKSLMELQGGVITLAVDGDLFKAILSFQVVE